MPAPKFTAEFLDRRLAEHRQEQERRARDLEAAIVSEVYVALALALGAQDEEYPVFDA